MPQADESPQRNNWALPAWLKVVLVLVVVSLCLLVDDSMVGGDGQSFLESFLKMTVFSELSQ